MNNSQRSVFKISHLREETRNDSSRNRKVEEKHLYKQAEEGAEPRLPKSTPPHSPEPSVILRSCDTEQAGGPGEGVPVMGQPSGSPGFSRPTPLVRGGKPGLTRLLTARARQPAGRAWAAPERVSEAPRAP